MRCFLAGLCALAFSSAAFGQEGFCGPGCGPIGPPPEIVIPGSGYSTYAQVFPPGCCYSSYALVFPPGFGYSAWGRMIPTPGLGCDGPLPSVPLCGEMIPPPVVPARRR